MDALWCSGDDCWISADWPIRDCNGGPDSAGDGSDCGLFVFILQEEDGIKDYMIEIII